VTTDPFKEGQVFPPGEAGQADTGSHEAEPASPSGEASWDGMVLVGRVARAHGIRGQVVVNPETDFVAERFRDGAQLWTRVKGQEQRLTIAGARLEGRRPILAFDGVASIEEAEALAGAELRIPESALQALPDGSYYLHQLVGCRVETVEGAAVGEVGRVDGGAGAAVLAVNGARGEVLVPLVQAICVGIDVAARVIRVRMPDGLLELNEANSTRSDRRATRGKARLAGAARSRTRR
jgi:16S rRNA processing protein RimM